MNKNSGFALLILSIALMSACRRNVTHNDSDLGIFGPTGELAPAVSETTEYSFADGTVERIQIDSPAREFKVVDSADGQIHISATVVAGTQQEIDRFKSAAQKTIGPREVVIRVSGGPIYQCKLKTLSVFGKTTRQVAGVCVEDVVIALPPGAGRTMVIYNGVPTRGLDRSGASQLRDLVHQQSTSSAKLGLLEQFARERREPVTADYFVAVLPEFSFGADQTDAARFLMSTVPPGARMISIQQIRGLLKETTSGRRLELCDVMSGHVSDPQNAAEAKDEIGFSSYDQQQGVRALSR